MYVRVAQLNVERLCILNTVRATVEARNALETYLYNLKTSYEDTLKDKISDDDLQELKASVEAGLEVRVIVEHTALFYPLLASSICVDDFVECIIFLSEGKFGTFEGATVGLAGDNLAFIDIFGIACSSPKVGRSDGFRIHFSRHYPDGCLWA